MNFEQFESRKRDHLRHALDPVHQAAGLGGLDRVRLVHEALPELDFDEVSLKAPCLGRELPTPFYVAGMTAGHAQAPALNRTLASACAARGWALGVGSQRRDLEGTGGSLDQWSALRREFPDLFLVANIGLSQLVAADPDRVLGLASELGANSIAIHANALQETLQPEGTPRFKGGLAALSRLCKASKVPVVLKETGCGFSKATLSKVAAIGLGAVDVSGLGGTHWGRIEGARAGETSAQDLAAASRTFADWGEPTADSVLAAREAFAQVPARPEIWASGGIRSGLDAAKAIALGAERVGFAKPALERALESRDALESWMKVTEYELKISLFCTGSRSVGALETGVMDTHRELVEGFHKLPRLERLRRVQELCRLSDEEIDILGGAQALPVEVAEHLIENVVGYFPIPLGVATNFCIDGKDTLIPMAVEETSIIAAASATAKWVRASGEIRTRTEGNLIIGQIQLPSVRNPAQAKALLDKNREQLVERANELLPGLVSRGGGMRDLIVRELPRATGDGTMIVLHLLCDPCDAMGANLINQVCEALKPSIEELTGERVGLCILSNLVDSKLAVAEVRILNIDPAVGKGIEEAAIFAKSDPYRAATHNKGVLNGIDPILIATGNDWRAVEAGVHAYAARSGRYQPVTDWVMEGRNLIGSIKVPMAVGTVGGVTRLHPTARVALKMLGATRSEDLARICAAVGLVQNLGALKALATVGIVKGHMQLHAANLAIAAGAEVHEIPQVRDRLAEMLKVEKHINLTRAKEILADIRRVPGSSPAIV